MLSEFPMHGVCEFDMLDGALIVCDFDVERCKFSLYFLSSRLRVRLGGYRMRLVTKILLLPPPPIAASGSCVAPLLVVNFSC